MFIFQKESRTSSNHHSESSEDESHSVQGFKTYDPSQKKSEQFLNSKKKNFLIYNKIIYFFLSIKFICS